MNLNKCLDTIAQAIGQYMFTFAIPENEKSLFDMVEHKIDLHARIVGIMYGVEFEKVYNKLYRKTKINYLQRLIQVTDQQITKNLRKGKGTGSIHKI